MITKKELSEIGEALAELKPERRIVNVEVDGINTRDAPDFCDAYISYAEWSDTGEALTEDELTEIDSSVVYDHVIDWLY